MKKTCWIALLALASLLPPCAQAQAPAMRESSPGEIADAGRVLEKLRQDRSNLLQGARGILVVGVETGSQADAAGIQPGDVIARYGEMPVNDMEKFVAEVSRLATAAKEIELTLIRRQARMLVRLKPGKVGVKVGNVISLDGGPSPAGETFSAPAGNRAQLFAQLGHANGTVSKVAVSPDGRLALSGSFDGAVKVWDLDSGMELRTFYGHTKLVTSVAFSPSGRHALSGSWDGTWRLWEVDSGKLIQSVGGLRGINAVAFSPDGRQALTAHNDGKVKLWDLATGFTLRTLDEPSKLPVSAEAVAFTPDGKNALASVTYSSEGMLGGLSRKHVLRQWDVASGKVLRIMAGHSEKVNALAVSPDGRWALSGSDDKSAKQWDLESGQEIRSFHGHSLGVEAVAFSPDGRMALSAGNELKLWEVATGKEIRSFLHTTQADVPAVVAIAKAAAFVPNGRQIVSGHMLGGMAVWDLSSGKEIRRLNGNAAMLETVAFGPDGKRIATAGATYGMSVWDALSGKKVWDLPAATPADVKNRMVSSVAFTPDGERLLSGHWDGTLQARDAGTGKMLNAFKGHAGTVKSIAVSRDGRLAVSGAGIYHSDLLGARHDNSIRLWNVDSGENVRTLKVDTDVLENFVALSPDGKRGMSSNGLNKGIALWDLSSSLQLRSFPGHLAAFGPDGRLAAVAGNRTVKLYDLDSGQEVRTLGQHAEFVRALAFSPDGSRVLSGGADHVLKLWNAASGGEICSMRGHTAHVTAIAFKPDGRLAVSSSWDSTARIWDLETCKERAQMVSFTDGEWLSITPEGYFAASSPKAAAHLNIRQGTKVYGIDQFYDVFYRPDLVELALAGKDIAPLVALTVDDALRGPPPAVTAVDVPAATDGEKVKVTYRIQSAGGGIGDVRVFHNGKLVHSDGTARPGSEAFQGKKAQQLTGEVLVGQMRSLAADAAKNAALKGAVVTVPKPEHYEATVEIEPVPGDNDVAVVAFNAQNSIQSVARTASFASTRPPVAPRLFILAVGIDAYKDKSVSLAFANKDARDIAARWPAQAAALYGEGKVFAETLANAQATRQGILNKIGELASRIRPTDHFVLFVASHGVLLGDQYYMVTHDYDGNLQPGKLVSANEIVEFSKRIKALSQLYILDTCHAGGLEGVVAGLYDARVSVLAKRMGLHVFASASSAQEALDGFEGNGLFTHTLLAGLNNNAQADSNADRQVSVAELGGFAQGRTRDIATRLKHRQEPLILQFGQDRAVYRLK